MQVSYVKATNIEWTDAIDQYLNEKLDPILKVSQELNEAAKLDIEFGKSTRHHNKGPYYRCEMTLQVPGREVIRIEEEAEDLYAAIDAAKDQLRFRLADLKERMVDERRQPRPDKE